ncbi:hypothetical protein BJX64DRAFT_25495 [Aspergillus heterothallicus]
MTLRRRLERTRDCAGVLGLVTFLWVAYLGWVIVKGVYYIFHPHKFITMLRLRGGSAPVALSRARPSLIFSLRQPTKARATSTQEQSPFFRLPSELRQIIYRHVLVPDAPIHVRRTHRRLCSTPCKGLPHSQNCAQRMAEDGTVARRLLDEPPRQDTVLPLLRTCRRICSEAADLIYTANVLHFEDLATLAIFPQCVTPARLSSIRHVRLDLFPLKDGIRLAEVQTGWQSGIDALAAMHGLLELTVRIPWSLNLPRWETHRAYFLDPLKKVTASKSFIVEVPPSGDLESNVDGVDEDDPYTLVANAELQITGNSCCNWWGGGGDPFPFLPPFKF